MFTVILVGAGTKEVAFAQAVWSAAVTEAVARSCREVRNTLIHTHTMHSRHIYLLLKIQ